LPPAARITDMHTCPLVSPGPVPHVGGPVITGEPTVIVAGMPQARISDKCTCAGPPDVIVKGSPTVIVGGMPAARMGDMTAHGGVIVTGAPNVLIGEAGAGGAPPVVLSPICQQLAGALTEAEQAKEDMELANAAYEAEDIDLPGGWERASDDDLRELGLIDSSGNNLTRIEGTDFRADVFVRPDPNNVSGGKEYTIAFRGTTSFAPWSSDTEANVGQSLGRDTAYYSQAIEIGERAALMSPGPTRIVGHSLGGGMASAAAGAGGFEANTFNAAGLHNNTIAQLERNDEAQVNAYFIEGEALSALQDSTGLPAAAGERRVLPQPRSMPGEEVEGWFLRDTRENAAAARQSARMHERVALLASLDQVIGDIRDEQKANDCP